MSEQENPLFKLISDAADKYTLAEKAGIDHKISYKPNKAAVLTYVVCAIVVVIIAAVMNANDEARRGHNWHNTFYEWIAGGTGWAVICAIPAYILFMVFRVNKKLPQTKEKLQEEVLKRGYESKTFAEENKVKEAFSRKRNDSEF